ncbi:hypothetical protein BGX27_002316 [Mortierella sp. AM989]|nr:hypothetical protein BGX27_002316 [Mortierella sp. AM989]
MDVSGSIVFSVNPPSPLESDLCADDQESILRTWHTCEPTTEQPTKDNSSEAYARFEPDIMDHGIVSNLSGVETTPLNAGPRAITHPSRSADNLGSFTHTGNSEFSGKKSQGSPRRSSSNDSHRKSELYKTELCVSVSTGIPCKYGDNCQFAHNVQELQYVTRHPRYKTQFCTSFQSQGYCKYNDRCTFIHHPDEARVALASTHKESTPENLAWSNSTAPNSGADSGTITPALSLESKSNERLRAFSDPGIAYAEVSRDPAKPVDAANSSIATPGTLPHASQSISATISTPQIVNEQLGHMGSQNCTLPSLLRLQSKMVINHTSDTIINTAETFVYHHNVSDCTQSICYPSDSGEQPIAGQVLGQSVAAFNPITGNSSTWSSPLFQRDPANPWCEATNVDDDERWASKLAYYISTPHNDFDI